MVDQREEEGDVDSSGCTLFSAVRQIGSVFNEGDRAREAKPRLDYRLPCISLASIPREIDTKRSVIFFFR